MSDQVQIHIDLLHPERQIARVEQIWHPRVLTQRFQLPVWTPGSYTQRDHVQHLHSLVLRCGDHQLAVRRTAPSRWQIDLPDLAPIHLSYAIEARHLTVRTCHLDPSFASLSLAALAMEVEAERWTEHRLRVSAPDAWTVHVPLPSDADGWIAESFDSLVDSPVHAGPFEADNFEVHGSDHELLLIGAPPGGWPGQLKRDVASVCRSTCDLMGTSPPAGDRYQLVIQMLNSGYGGLEHDHSAVLQYSWQALAKPDGYRQLLQLVGHEYLHQWNVRRLRPVEYLPYDYSGAVVSEGLWFAEGITSYFDLTTTLLAGCSTRVDFLRDLGIELSRVLMTPGRRTQSLAASAEEAWVKLYKATPASRDSQVSYYGLGAAAAFVLDVRLREVGSSLAVVLRSLWQSHGRQRRGYCRGDIKAALEGVDATLASDLDGWLDQPDSLPLDRTVGALGLRLDPIPTTHPNHGLTLSDEQGEVVVTRVATDGPAANADLVVGDEVLAVDGRRLRRSSDLPLLLRIGVEAEFTLSRRGLLHQTLLIPDEGIDHWRLDWDPGATAEQRALRERWFRIL